MKRLTVFLIFGLFVLSIIGETAADLNTILKTELKGDMIKAIKLWENYYDQNNDKLKRYVAINRIYDIVSTYKVGFEELERFLRAQNTQAAKYFLFYLERKKGILDEKILDDLGIMKDFYILGPLDYGDFSQIDEITKEDGRILGKNKMVTEHYVDFPYTKIYPSDILNESKFTRARIRNNFKVDSDGTYQIDFSFSDGILIKIDDKEVFKKEVLNQQGSFCYKINAKLTGGIHSLKIFTGNQEDYWELQLSFDKRISFLKDEDIGNKKKGDLLYSEVDLLFDKKVPKNIEETVLYGIALRYLKNFNREEKKDFNTIKKIVDDNDLQWGYYFLGELSVDNNNALFWYDKISNNDYSDFRNYLTAKLFYNSRYYQLAYQNIKKIKNWYYYNSALYINIIDGLNWDKRYKKFFDLIKEKKYYGRLYDNIFEDIYNKNEKQTEIYFDNFLERYPYSYFDISYAIKSRFDTLNIADNKLVFGIAKNKLLLSPFSEYYYIQYADLLLKCKKYDKFLSIIQKIHRRFIYSIDALRLEADYYLIKDDKDKAVEKLKEILKWKPQDENAIDLVAELTEKKDIARTLYEKKNLNIKDKVVLPDYAKDADVVQLYEKNIIELNESNSTTKFYEGLFYVNKISGIDKLSYYPIYYSSSSEYVELDKAIVISPDGTLFPITQHYSEPVQSYGNIYSDFQKFIIFIDNLQVGSKIYLKYRIIQYSNFTFKGKFPGQVEFIQNQFPALKKDYLLIIPKNKKVYYKLYNAKNSSDIEIREKFKIVKWQFNGLRQIVSFPYIAPYSEYGKYLVISTFKDWNEVYKWVYSLFKERLKPNKKIISVYKELKIDEQNGFEKKVEAIFKYVSREIHYLGIEYGLNGYQPRFPSKVIREKYGDCKDKATLMKVFFDLAGIRSNITLVRTRDIGSVETLPILTIFNHAVLTVYSPAGLPYIVDGTVDWGLPWEVPHNLTDGLAYEIDNRTYHFKKITNNPEQNNLITIKNSCIINGDMSLNAERELIKEGNAAFEARHLLDNLDTARESLQQFWSSVFPKVTVDNIKLLSDIDSKKIDYSYRLTIENFVNKHNKRFRPFINRYSLYDSYGTQKAITAPMLLPVEINTKTTTIFKLDEGYQFVYLPTYAPIDNEIFSAKLDIKKNSDKMITVNYRIRIKKREVPPNEYADFKIALLKLKEMMEWEVEIK